MNISDYGITRNKGHYRGYSGYLYNNVPKDMSVAFFRHLLMSDLNSRYVTYDGAGYTRYNSERIVRVKDIPIDDMRRIMHEKIVVCPFGERRS